MSGKIPRFSVMSGNVNKYPVRNCVQFFTLPVITGRHPLPNFINYRSSEENSCYTTLLTIIKYNMFKLYSSRNTTIKL